MTWPLSSRCGRWPDSPRAVGPPEHADLRRPPLPPGPRLCPPRDRVARRFSPRRRPFVAARRGDDRRLGRCFAGIAPHRGGRAVRPCAVLVCPTLRRAGRVPLAVADDPRHAARRPVLRPARDPPLRGRLRLHPAARTRSLSRQPRVAPRLCGSPRVAGRRPALPPDLHRRRRRARHPARGRFPERGSHRRRPPGSVCGAPVRWAAGAAAGHGTRRLRDVCRWARPAQESRDGRVGAVEGREPRSRLGDRRRLSRPLASPRRTDGCRGRRSGGPARVPRPCQ